MPFSRTFFFLLILLYIIECYQEIFHDSFHRLAFNIMARNEMNDLFPF